ncbi:hypothetical protein E2R51_13545 [Jeotgalibacillus sp. S-D1]|uniref:hypothetical protein n=1 Tax=Jeotgalibacillus sp. S-D1 TaxID=2552189 RepID=UPI00105938AA|nr:hypothetical protein [Jeotgalibacillus sp. S-D1]TDL31388.1 hypothetical protein E2R51_13545 [Jeotgalibacillus sp. S-D1]
MNTLFETLTKAEKMDSLITNETKVTPSRIYSIVNQVFNINLVEISHRYEEYNPLADESPTPSLPKIQLLDRKIEENEVHKNGPLVRTLINDVFGVNLGGISSLENSGISIYSKGQWICQSPNDLFIVQTELGDVDVTILPTPYFYEYTESKNISESMQHSLGTLGYTYIKEKDILYYKNPINKSVPDSFKGQTMGAVMKIIKEDYTNL